MWCVDNVVLLGASGDDLKLALEQFLDECEGRKGRNENRHLQVQDHGSQPENGEMTTLSWDELLPKVEEFKYLRVLFRTEEGVKPENDK